MREQTQRIACRKTEAIYVDFDETGIFTPESISADEAVELVRDVEVALHLVTKILDPALRRHRARPLDHPWRSWLRGQRLMRNRPRAWRRNLGSSPE